MDCIKWLEWWYKENCDGYWEHCYGIKIQTLDNPGWKIGINLAETDFEDRVFKAFKLERNEDDWIHCWVKDNVFEGAGGPGNLEEVLIVFRQWITESK